nr:MAG TPA: hypothetical protein [Caudoviricetes sp.]
MPLYSLFSSLFCRFYDKIGYRKKAYTLFGFCVIPNGR